MHTVHVQLCKAVKVRREMEESWNQKVLKDSDKAPILK